MKISPSQMNIRRIGLITGVATSVAVITLWSYQTYSLAQGLRRSEHDLASSTAAYSSIIRSNREHITRLQKENTDLYNSLSAEEKRRRDLEKLKQAHEEEIDTLTKLTTLDPELLKKYSKVYFLSENYVPPALDEVPRDFVIDPSRDLMILAQVQPFLNSLLLAAARDSLPLRVASSYRSFETQKDLKTGYRLTFGAGTANQFSAEQGYSEHQLGTTLDFTTVTLKTTDLDFENTSSFDWLVANAYKYGFVLSYPRGNGYYQYEPWHWRFVGKALATDLHNDGKYFYEYDQRKINDYLIKIFD